MSRSTSAFRLRKRPRTSSTALAHRLLLTGACAAALLSLQPAARAQDAAQPTQPALDMRWLDAGDEARYKNPNAPAAPAPQAPAAAAPAEVPISDADMARAIENQAPALAEAPAAPTPPAEVAPDAALAADAPAMDAAMDDMDAPYNGGAVIPHGPAASAPDTANNAAPSAIVAPAATDTDIASDADLAAAGSIADSADLAATAAQPDPAGDLYMILSHTHKTNPFLKAQREQLRLSHEQVFEAESGWLPIVTSDADISSQYNEVEPGGSSDNVAKTVSVSVIQPVFRSGRTVNAVDRETAAAQAAYFDYVGEMQSILLQTVTAYINVVAARSEVELNIQNVTRLEEENTSTEQQFEVGQLTRTDVSQSDARLARARSDVIRAEGALREALAVFRQVSGMDVPLDAFQFPDAARIPVSASLDEALMAAQINHPSIIAAENRIKSSDAAIAASYSELMPEIAVNGALERGYSPHPGILDSESSAIVSLSATMPFYDAGVSRSRVRQSKINKYIQTNNRESALRAVRSNVTSTWEDYTTAMAVMDSSMAQLEAARIAREGVYSEREVGTRTVLDALDADQELLDAQVALVGARRDLIVAKFALLEAEGALVPENLGFQRLITEKDNSAAARKTARRFFSTDVKPMDNSQ